LRERTVGELSGRSGHDLDQFPGLGINERDGIAERRRFAGCHAASATPRPDPARRTADIDPGVPDEPSELVIQLWGDSTVRSGLPRFGCRDEAVDDGGHATWERPGGRCALYCVVGGDGWHLAVRCRVDVDRPDLEGQRGGESAVGIGVDGCVAEAGTLRASPLARWSHEYLIRAAQPARVTPSP
jgi:hypothetical protein